MANDVKFEGKERRMAKIEKCLAGLYPGLRCCDQKGCKNSC